MFKVGIIGLGRMGKTRLKYILEDKLCNLVAVCDVDSAKVQDFSCSTYTDPIKMLEEEKLDIVFLCTFNWMLSELAIKALSLGVYVFSEKPPGKTSQDVLSIIKEEKKHPNLFVYYGFNHRKHFSVIQAKNLLDSGKLGKPLWYRGIYGKCGTKEFEKEWRNNIDLSGGGILLDQGIHMLDLIYYLGLKPTEIKSISTTQFWNMKADDNNMLLLSDGEKTALVHSLATQWKHKFSLEIGCSEGLIELTGLLTSTNSYGPEICRYYSKEDLYSDNKMGNPDYHETRYIKDESWKKEHDEFMSLVINHENKNCYFSRQAFDVMDIVTNVYKNS